MSSEVASPKAVDYVAQLTPYVPGKPIAELEREYGVSNVVKVASNENPLGPSPKVVDYLQQMLLHPQELARYPDGNGFVLKNKLLEFYSAFNSTRNSTSRSKEPLQLSVNQITLGNGSNDILDLLARTFAGQNDEVIFSQYAFAVYPIATQAVGATAVITPAKNWGHDLDAMLEAITDKTRLIFIANPNNPTGTCLSAKDLLNFIKQVPANIVVVIDEAYEEYASSVDSPYVEQYQSMLNVLYDFENLVISRTFSKAYGLASFRVGYAFSSSVIADLLNRVRQPFNNNTFALEAAAIALSDQNHIERSAALNWQGMNYLIESFTQLGLDYIPSAGNFICVNIGTECAQIYEKLLYEGVITRPVANYQMPEFLRISLGSMDENKRVINALQNVLGKLSTDK
ncbi:histidinol-phosphate transaminase [sulfur-oxidizing endosymbiont of Gigantopelta aegis]|uniref:histidinol-phosphate transaminase n=1 Tax=sulfur-oxidizing endosymbiont of Gigantopelta aegis TaxID=2794934 RepID=UPI0018DCF109|nr:histidinol-phosphate transaminase [sulfur-oxidizing endosymbiont of Gigantopelta aegis]